MAVKLSVDQKAALADCSCPLPDGRRHSRLSKKMIILPPIIFGFVLWLFWALWPPSLWWLLGVYGVMVVGNFVYRLIRGHRLGCSLKWSPIATLYIIADALATGLSF